MSTPPQPSARHDAHVCVHNSRVYTDTAFCVHTHAVRFGNSAVFRISYRDALRADSMPIPQNGLFPRISTRAPRYNPHHKRLHPVLSRAAAVQHIKIPLSPQSYRRPTPREPNPCRLQPAYDQLTPYRPQSLMGRCEGVLDGGFVESIPTSQYRRFAFRSAANSG